MSLVASKFDGHALTLVLSGSIDTTNATQVEASIRAEYEAHPHAHLVLDFADITYISSAGLRVLLRLKKAVKDLHIIDVGPDVYGIFDMTGFAAIIDVRRAFKEVSVEGCPVIGEGAQGVLYRLNDEIVCKVFRNPDSLDQISHERELAKSAFVAGLPTAISFDVVRVGDSYGSVFELLDAKTVSELLASGEWDVERAATEMAELLKQLGATKADTSLVKPVRGKILGWADRLAGVLDDGTLARIKELIEAVPDDPYLVHGDFHIRNIMVQDGEPLLIDLDTLKYGNNVFDLGITFSTHVGRGLYNQQRSERFLGIPYETSRRLWALLLRNRFPEASDEELLAIEDKARLIGAMRLMGRPVEHPDIDEVEAQKIFSIYGGIIDEVLPRIDSLAL